MRKAGQEMFTSHTHRKKSPSSCDVLVANELRRGTKEKLCPIAQSPPRLQLGLSGKNMSV